jgi:hypothetical protein
MKTAAFLLIAGLMVSGTISAQTKLFVKPDSLRFKFDTTHVHFQNHMNLNNPYGNEKLQLVFPNKQIQVPNLAVVPNQKPLRYADPNFRMPVANPGFQSNMPVMKPDSTIHYHLQIKKIGK